eukprot:3074233-Amphidinium_carterae.2
MSSFKQQPFSASAADVAVCNSKSQGQLSGDPLHCSSVQLCQARTRENWLCQARKRENGCVKLGQERIDC